MSGIVDAHIKPRKMFYMDHFVCNTSTDFMCSKYRTEIKLNLSFAFSIIVITYSNETAPAKT